MSESIPGSTTLGSDKSTNINRVSGDRVPPGVEIRRIMRFRVYRRDLAWRRRFDHVKSCETQALVPVDSDISFNLVVDHSFRFAQRHLAKPQSNKSSRREPCPTPSPVLASPKRPLEGSRPSGSIPIPSTRVIREGFLMLLSWSVTTSWLCRFEVMIIDCDSCPWRRPMWTTLSAGRMPVSRGSWDLSRR